MFKKILIANRGEIAVRIIRACNEMGIQTVAVYSDIDKDALHTQMADEAICIGPAKSKDSYLNMQNILSATVLTGAEAIHPGYGFLSENSKFAQMCEECNIKYIGPSSENIDNMGNKLKAREIMIKAWVPVVPGSDGEIATQEDAISSAEKIGYPVMIKASAGGGGRGIRVVKKVEDLILAYNTAKAESKTAFGDDTMYMEKFIEEPRHIEFQILADEHGNVIHLGERDCSVQRRNQKVIEEAPGYSMTQELRKQMGEVAVKAASSINYKNAGTIEFLLDKYGKYYFMEMNTRIQVEHPITEMITGVDLVKAQIRIASGELLSYKQEDIKIEGHAIECRINAENPNKNFMPCPGVIKSIHLPGGYGIRIDSAAYQGYKIPHTYDSMIGKLIVFGKDREEAIRKMRRALREFIIEGVDTNIDFQFKILNNQNFINGNFDTSFINKEFQNL
ncbi:acetyl-CoA carboxylase biotin carboxylase subunit [Clostridium lacusfryxellense]|uniref:acetyl-CoA carboxylase biotin carboxylase subunit n=1 Tax=Clostridium lacusfryxellense TaxID=205328 RepID=UPI001C0C2CD1|nr:acetyl-CoA carboxylase biotin carboxylase subunit [Clostridium lacusfryxellense]MBU3112559.1 acetyl-CoA carboxylase biotin carboxylase subunit [Clostridium lacusfryxellense]